MAKLRQIIERKLYELPMDDVSVSPTAPQRTAAQLTVARPLELYSLLFGGIYVDH